MLTIKETVHDMEITHLIHNDLMFPRMAVQTQGQLLNELAAQLKAHGYVKEGYRKGVIEREKRYPTGIQLKNLGCALPHTDIEHVIKPAIAVATLKHPVVFKRMENAHEEVPVRIVVMLAVSKPSDQVEALQQLAMLLQNDEFINKMLQATGKEEIYRAFFINRDHRAAKHHQNILEERK
jgi:PTS system galactitol-specific IIA component